MFRDLKRVVYECNMEIRKRGLAVYTFGNVSAIDRKTGVFAIKPSGVPYETLKADDIVVLDLDGRVVDGKLNPSSDTPTHLLLYKTFAAVGGIVHTHSVYATAWAQACRPIPIYGTTHADHLPEDVPVTEVISDEAIGGDYEMETGLQITRAFLDRDPSVVEMVLVAGHGPFTWGSTPEKAVYNAAVLEELARMAWLTETINPSVGRLKSALVRRHFERKHGPSATYGQSKEHQ